MDISKASNFERFVFDLLGRDAPRAPGPVRRCTQQWGRFDLKRRPAFRRLPPAMASSAASSTQREPPGDDQVTYDRFGQMIDTTPPTASRWRASI